MGGSLFWILKMLSFQFLLTKEVEICLHLCGRIHKPVNILICTGKFYLKNLWIPQSFWGHLGERFGEIGKASRYSASPICGRPFVDRENSGCYFSSSIIAEFLGTDGLLSILRKGPDCPAEINISGLYDLPRNLTDPFRKVEGFVSSSLTQNKGATV